MRPFHGCTHCGGVVETEKVVGIVDQYIELAQKIFAENAAKVEIDGMGIPDVKHEYLLAGDRMGADFEQVELREGCRSIESDSCYHGRVLSIQMELSGQRRIDHRDLGSGVQQKVVGAGVVDGYRHDHLVAVCETEGYTGDVSGTMRFCGECRDDGCGKNERCEAPEI
jgi:hypothetical protein